MAKEEKLKIPSDIFQITTENRIDYITLKMTEIPVFRLLGIFTKSKRKVIKQVTLNDFYMAEFPVTQELYKAILGENPSYFKGDRRPVENVSWYDAIEFCNLLSKKVGLKGYYNIDKYRKDPNNENKDDDLKWTVTTNNNANGFRLPTESQWEYAARGVVETLHATSLQYAGSNILDHVGWYNENSHQETNSVGLKFPNALGLYDMSGNVSEWCWDWYGSYETANQTNPVGPQKVSPRVGRGGSWGDYAAGCTTADRCDWYPGSRNGLVGFRVVFVP